MQEAESGIVASPKRSSHHKLACSAHSPTASRNMHSLVLRDLFSAPGLMERYFPIGLHISIAKFFFSMHFFSSFRPWVWFAKTGRDDGLFFSPLFFFFFFRSYRCPLAGITGSGSRGKRGLRLGRERPGTSWLAGKRGRHAGATPRGGEI